MHTVMVAALGVSGGLLPTGSASLALEPGGLLAWLVAALLAGWLAGRVVRGRGFGCMGDVLLGLIGAAVGSVVLGLLPLALPSTLHFFGTLVVAFLGALLLVSVARLLGGTRPRRRYY